MRRNQDALPTFLTHRSDRVSGIPYNPSIVTSKPTDNRAQQKNCAQESRSQETILWGLAKHESPFQTTYGSQYANNRSSKIVQRVVDEPYLPETQLTKSMIPHQTPKFIKGKRTLEPDHLKLAGESEDTIPRNTRKQFPDATQRDSRGTDISPSGRRIRTSVSPMDRTDSPARVLKNLEQRSSHVHEIIHSEPADLSSELSMYTQTIDEYSTAGASNLRNRFSPAKNGRKISPSRYNDSPMKEILSNSFRSIDDQSLSRKEILSMTEDLPSLSLNLRPKTHRDHNRSSSPIPMRCETPQERSFSQFRPDSSRAHRGLATEPDESTFTPIKGLPIQTAQRSGKNSMQSTFRSRNGNNLFEDTTTSTPRDHSDIVPKLAVGKLERKGTEEGPRSQRNTDFTRARTPVDILSSRRDGSQTGRSTTGRRTSGERTAPQTERNLKKMFTTTSDKKPVAKPLGKFTISKPGMVKQGLFSNVNKLYETFKK